jgi:hypothetical protein
VSDQVFVSFYDIAIIGFLNCSNSALFLRKPMDNQEIMATLDTRDTGREQTKHSTTQKNQKDEQHGHYQKPRVNMRINVSDQVFVSFYDIAIIGFLNCSNSALFLCIVLF